MSGNNTESHSHGCTYHVDSSTEQVFKCIAYFIIMFTSLIGNALVICVVSMNRHMRTVTNYFIVNMAVADLLLTVFNMPLTIRLIITGDVSWFTGVFAEILCKIISFIQPLSVASSVLSLTAIAVDRFLAIIFPLKCYMTFQISSGIITAIWIVGIGVNSPFLYAQKVILGPDSKWYCYEDWTPVFSEGAAQDFTIVLFVVFYAVPLLTMSVLYSFIIHKLWVRKMPGNQSVENQLRASKSKKKVLKMLLAVVILFALCWLPVYISQFISFFARETFRCGPPASLLFMGFFLGHGNSAISPTIYVIFNENFRKGFRNVLLCRCRRNRVAPLSNAATILGADNSYIDGAAAGLTRSPVRVSETCN